MAGGDGVKQRREHARQSNRGEQYQSMVPSVLISATVCRLPITRSSLLAEHRPAQDHPLMASQAGQESLELRQQPTVRLGVVVGLGQVDVPLAVDRGAVVRVGEILGREPEVERVLGDVVEREPRREAWCAGAKDRAISFTEHLDVPEREDRVLGAPVKVVEPERLLELCPVRRPRHRDHGAVQVGHVMPPDARLPRR